ncbi:MAG: hypothetical protein ABH952_08200 [Candidatus Omnitrophota bacterium]
MIVRNNFISMLIIYLIIASTCPTCALAAGASSISVTVTIKEITSGVMVIAPESQSGYPGKTLTYVFTVKNNGYSLGIYRLEAVSSNNWETSFPEGNIIGPLNSGEQKAVIINLVIPKNAVNVTKDILILTATALSISPDKSSGSVTTFLNQLSLF